MHPDFGKTYTPELEIVDWTLMDVEPEEVEEEPKKPARATRAKVVEEAAEEAVEAEATTEDKPRPRRRRPASK